MISRGSSVVIDLAVYLVVRYFNFEREVRRSFERTPFFPKIADDVSACNK